MSNNRSGKPDVLGEELFAVLSKKRSLEFKALFEILHARLIARNAVSGGEDIRDTRRTGDLRRLARGCSGMRRFFC